MTSRSRTPNVFSIAGTVAALLLRIKHAGRSIYDDEVGHGEHGVEGVELTLTTEAEFARIRDMLVSICQERLRMRAEMFGGTMSEQRIVEITDGRIEPLAPLD